MKNELTRARTKLLSLYFGIIGMLVLLFSLLVIYAAQDSLLDTALTSRQDIVLMASEAIALAEQERPGVGIQETEYEIEGDSLYFAVTYADDTEVKFDLLSGVSHVPEETGFIAGIVDDFDEMVWWIAILVFILAASLAAYVVNATLRPISKNMERQRQFISDAAHELRNPLAAMHARIESVLRVGEKHVAEEALADVLAETKRLIVTSESLLSLEKGGQRTREVRLQSMGTHIEGVFARLRHQASEKDVRLVADTDSEEVSIDSDDLDMLLYNVTHNAIKFTPQGGLVTLSWKNRVLTVTDTGTGIAADDLAHIFDRFYKADASRGTEGSGLGLTLVKEIADRYKINVNVESSAGAGTSFIFTWA